MCSCSQRRTSKHNLTESESKAVAARAQASSLEDDKAALQQSLAGEREALGDARQAISRLQRDLSELQGVSAAASAQSVSDRVSGLKKVQTVWNDKCHGLSLI